MLTRSRILLKADISEAGEGWSDSAIAAALDTSVNNVARTRQQLVEEGFEATLSRKYNPNSARPRIFDGAAEAKLIALALWLARPLRRGSLSILSSRLRCSMPRYGTILKRLKGSRRGLGDGA